jgi:hypothetical protein
MSGTRTTCSRHTYCAHSASSDHHSPQGPGAPPGCSSHVLSTRTTPSTVQTAPSGAPSARYTQPRDIAARPHRARRAKRTAPVIGRQIASGCHPLALRATTLTPLPAAAARVASTTTGCTTARSAPLGYTRSPDRRDADYVITMCSQLMCLLCDYYVITR